MSVLISRVCGYVSITVVHFNIILPFAPTLPLGLFPLDSRIKVDFQVTVHRDKFL